MFKKLLHLGLVLSILPGCAPVVVVTAATSALVAQDRRTTGTIIEDKTIQIKAQQAINEQMKGHPKARVRASSFNNRVLLVGQAPTFLRKDIELAVRDIEKVKQLHNEIIDAPVISLKQQSKDSLITTKIKSDMALEKEFNPTRVKVITENGVVYLMGLVVPREEEIAVEIARHTRGVHKVIKIFEYESRMSY